MRNIIKAFCVFTTLVAASANLNAQTSGPYIRVGAKATTWSMFCGIGGDVDTRYRFKESSGQSRV